MYNSRTGQGRSYPSAFEAYPAHLYTTALCPPHYPIPTPSPWHSEPPPHISAIPLTLPQPHEVSTLSSLKPVEDMLDALICAWIGIEHLEGRTVGLGDATAAIWVPQALTNHSPE